MKIQKLHKIKLFNRAINAMSTCTNLSAVWSMDGATSFSLETKWGVHVHGTFTLWEKNAGSYRQNTDVTFTKVTVSTGGQILNVIDAGADSYKLVYTHQSGTTGPIDAWVTIKDFT